MQVIMLKTVTASPNRGRTRQEFEAGLMYDLPEDVADALIREGAARRQDPVEPPAPPVKKQDKGPSENK